MSFSLKCEQRQRIKNAIIWLNKVLGKQNITFLYKITFYINSGKRYRYRRSTYGKVVA